MKAIYLILNFIFATITGADLARTFYRKVEDRFERLSAAHTPMIDLITLKHPHFPPAPMFTLVDGVPTTGEGEDIRVFGKYKSYFVIGSKQIVTPFKIQLGNDSKVLNLQVSSCICSWGNLRGRRVYKESDKSDLKCSPKDIYFLTPDEAK